MKGEHKFRGQPKPFWATIRSLTQKIGYTERGTGKIKIPTVDEVKSALESLGLEPASLVASSSRPTKFGKTVLDYFAHRANVLNTFVEPRLMDAARARALYEELKRKHKPSQAPPMNKQRGKKRAPAYFTAIINMLIEANINGFDCDFNPRQLTTVTQGGLPLRTLARRVDGAFPSTVNPIAIWETKEYYYTTTFGSRVADGVYESLLDGMELEELREHEGVDVKHYLMIDDHRTWWMDGRSYLCRIVDMLHMGYVDEVLFGAEVTERLPALARGWVAQLRRRKT